MLFGSLESKLWSGVYELESKDIIQCLCFRDVTESTWSTEGVVTELARQDPDKKTYDVVCRSTHLTSFAVLLDVNNALSVRFSW